MDLVYRKMVISGSSRYTMGLFVRGRWFMRLLLAIVLSVVLLGCGPKVPHDTLDICQIFLQNLAWYRAAKQSEKKWGVPIAVQMAIINQESHFAAKIKPDRQQFLGVIPRTRPSSSKGYTQALKTTWNNYEKSQGKTRSRSDFRAATDFVGWYGAQAYRRAKIPKNDPYQLYLAYHEGIGGYQRQTYLKKKWLIHVAKRVDIQSSTYAWQLQKCEKKFRRKKWMGKFN